ncbi:MAG TPA: hypothetical protein VLU73_06495 [Methylococcaceae bacterium]|nr:hypothetical protein [Methylococcaceae bacterium]
MTTNISTSSNPPSAGVSAVPSEAQLRVVPAAAAGASGLSPQPLITPPTSASAEPLYYFLDSARPTTPQTVPALNLAPPGFEPPLGVTAPTTATAADPRALLGRTAAPGQQFGSTAPVTPAVELGAQPFVPAVPPASAFRAPSEEPLRGAPAVAAGAAGVSPQPLVTAPGASESLYYFLESVAPTSPRTVPAVNLAPSDAGFGAVPDLGLASPRVATASPYFLAETWSPPQAPPAPEVEASGFRPEVVPATASRSS